MIPFKVGDYIINTEPLIFEGETLAGVAIKTLDHSWMTTPIKIIEVTEAHIVYEFLLCPGWAKKSVLSFYDLEECSFIIANPALVKATWGELEDTADNTSD